MKFTKNEVKDLIISVVVLALVFSAFDFNMFIPLLFVIIAVFVSHEILGHKLVAQHFDCDAEYRLWPMGLLLGVITAFLGGFIFAAPGAVYISPYVRKGFAFTVARLGNREYAMISAAGPIVNIIIGFAALATSVFFFNWEILLLTAKISFFLAVFNLIPFPPLDGQKIINWDWRIWLMLIISSVVGYGLLSIYL